MKKTIVSLFAVAFLLPSVALAASVQVIPTLINAQGGRATGADLRTCITQGEYSECATDMPTFFLPGAGNFEVSFYPPAGYSYETNYRCPAGSRFDYKTQREVCVGAPDRTITCSGTIAADEGKKCYVVYADGAPIYMAPAPVLTPPNNPAPAPSRVPSVPLGGGDTVVAPKSGLTLAQCDAILGLLRAFGVEETTVAVVSAILK